MKRMLIFLLLFSFLFPAECKPSWSEDVFIKVVDHYSRPLENATVQIYFQMAHSGIEDEGIYGLANLTTGRDGMVLAKLRNSQWYEPKLDCTYDIFVDYKGRRKEMRDVLVGKHSDMITFVFEDVYVLTVKVKDENGNPIPATIMVNGEKKNVDDVVASFTVVEGIVNITILYAGGQRSVEIWVEDDRMFDISVSHSNLTVAAFNDAGEGMECVFQLENKNYSFFKTLTLGVLKGTYYGKIICQGKERELDIDMAKRNEYFVVFDLRAPIVKNISLDKNGTMLVIEAEDPGKMASGIVDVWVVYPKDNAKYTAFKEKSGVYKAVFKEGSSGFVVFLKDGEGNTKSVEGVVKVLEGEEEKKEKVEEGADWGPFMTILFVVVVVLAGFLFKLAREQTGKA